MLAVKEIERHFVALSRSVPLGPISSEGHYDKLIEIIAELMDAGAANEAHPLAALLATIGGLVGDYEQSRYKAEPVSAVSMLSFLMSQHGLRQSDLPEVGSQGVVSEILSGKRALNVRQIQALAARFGVAPAVFI